MVTIAARWSKRSRCGSKLGVMTIRTRNGAEYSSAHRMPASRPLPMNSQLTSQSMILPISMLINACSGRANCSKHASAKSAVRSVRLSSRGWRTQRLRRRSVSRRTPASLWSPTVRCVVCRFRASSRRRSRASATGISTRSCGRLARGRGRRQTHQPPADRRPQPASAPPLPLCREVRVRARTIRADRQGHTAQPEPFRQLL